MEAKRAADEKNEVAREERQSLPSADFLFEVEYSGDKGMIWLQHKTTKHQWECVVQSIGDFTQDEPSYPLHVVMRYIEASFEGPRPPEAPLDTKARLVQLVRDGDDFVVEVAVYLMLDTEKIMESRYRFPLRRVQINGPEMLDLRTQLQRADDGVKQLGGLSRKLEQENRRLQASSQELDREVTQKRAKIARLEELNKSFEENNRRLQLANQELSTRVTQQQITIDQLSRITAALSGMERGVRSERMQTVRSPPRLPSSSRRHRGSNPPATTTPYASDAWPFRSSGYRQNRSMPRQ